MRNVPEDHNLRQLPDGWQPTCLDPLEREEYDHLAGWCLTSTEVVDRLGWSREVMARRWHRHKKAAAA